jgi:hypothetical protein
VALLPPPLDPVCGDAASAPARVDLPGARRPDSVSHPQSRQQFRPSFDAIVLPPAFGAVLMSLSTVIVAINAQLLRRVNL